jgi:hypothetical protein
VRQSDPYQQVTLVGPASGWQPKPRRGAEGIAFRAVAGTGHNPPTTVVPVDVAEVHEVEPTAAR